MKKIALLFTLLCAGALSGMESQKNDLGAFEQLPLELRKEIFEMTLKTSTTVDEAIKAIQNASEIYRGVRLDSTAALNLLIKTIPDDLDKAIEAVKNLQGNTLKDFTKLVHILANKFNTTTQAVAEKINTPTARIYLTLGNELLTLAGSWRKEREIISFIQAGADINFTGDYFDDIAMFYITGSPLGVAAKNLNVREVETLLEFGAKPTDEDLLRAEQMANFSSEKIKRRRQGLQGNEADEIYSLLLNAQINELEEQLPVKAKKRKK